jgi:hypothetical protein
MNDTILNFIQTKQIDSFQKLRFLLFLAQHPELKVTFHDLSLRLCLGDVRLLEKIVADLTAVGLLIGSEPSWQLCDEPEIRASLGHLSRLFDSPTSRQDLLARVMGSAVASS